MFSRWFGFSVQKHEIAVVDGDTINYRPGGWPGGQIEGTRKFRLRGRLKSFDAPEVSSKAKSIEEGRWGDLAKAVLEEKIARAGRLKLKRTGEWTDRGNDEVVVLLMDGQDAADVMIDANMAREADWDANGKFKRPDWLDLWDQRPQALR
jgi:endonuclease YncB( thermonuclease family)